MHFFQQILVDLGIRHTVQYARPLFESERHGGSLSGVKRLLTHYGVQVSAVYADDHQLEGMPYPMVISHRGWPIVLRKAPAADSDINREWDGYALLCDASHAREPHYLHNLLKQWVQTLFPWTAAMAALLTLAASVAFPFQLHRALLTLLSAVGLYFSLRSAQGECAGSCSRVTASAGGKIWGLYPLSVAGAAWFLLSLLVWMTIPAWQEVWSVAAVAMLLMPVWSIGYQAFVVHAWCRNCLAVQAVVVASAAVVLQGDICFWQWGPALLLVASLVTLFYLLWRIYLLYQTLHQPKVDPTLISLMGVPALREEIIRSGTSVDTSALPAIDLGGEGRELVTMLSLHCSHCRDLFRRLYPLWQKGKLSSYHWKLVLSTYPNDAPVAESIAATALRQDAAGALSLLAEWYDHPAVRPFEKRHRQLAPSEEVRQLLHAQTEWLDQKRVSSMPTLLLDGHTLATQLFEGIIENEQT